MRNFKTLILLVFVALPASGADETFEKVVEPFLHDYCIKCHGPDAQKGDRRYDTIQPDFANVDSTILWHDILDQLLLEEMPPKDPMPTSENRDQVIAWLTKKFEEQRAASRVSENGTVMRRLSHLEYAHTLDDLFQLEEQEFFHYESDLARDDILHGFDTDAEQLKMSRLLFQQYYEIAGRFIERALPFSKPDLTTETFPGRSFSGGRFMVVDTVDESNLYADFTSKSIHKDRGGPPWVAPVDGRYKFRINAEMVDRYLNRAHHRTPEEGVPWLLQVFKCSANYGGINKANVSDRDITILTMEEGKQDYEVEAYFEKGYTIRLHWKNGGRGAMDRRNYPVGFEGPKLRVHEIGVTGPFFDQWPPRPQRLVFGKSPPKKPGQDYSRKVLRDFAERAWRRPVKDEELMPFYQLTETTLEEEGFAAIAKGLRGILCTPTFLYHYQNDGRLDGYALASRLSYFLWGSAPDEVLLSAIKDSDSGQFENQEQYLEQVDRLIADPRLDRMIADFSHQWLGFDNLRQMPPDDTKFKNYYSLGIGKHATEETRRFVKHLIENNLSIYHCLDSDFAILNQPMASLYGIQGVTGDEFRKVNLPEYSRRGGLLTQASVLTATSNGVDTSPIVRGVFVLENILGIQPTPPPADVEPIDPDTRGAKTIKEQLIAHREKETCNNCHRTFDYLGLSLENYDAIGQWRTRYDKETLVDPVTESPTGEEIKNIEELKTFLLEKRKRFFAIGLAEKLMAYAVGREMSHLEQGELEEVYLKIQKQDGFRDLLKHIVTSDIFLNR